mgnify:CR=1 FL=1
MFLANKRTYFATISNIGFIGYDLDIGKAGQVVAQDIKWIKDTDGKYKLVVIELD